MSDACRKSREEAKRKYPYGGKFDESDSWYFHSQGFNAGYETGRAEGIRVCEEQMRHQLQTVHRQLRELREKMQALDKNSGGQPG